VLRDALSLGAERAREQGVAARSDRQFAWRAAAPTLTAVFVYAVAMAYVESAAVLYLRTIYGGIDPVGPRSSILKPVPDFVWVELGREAATMLMLGAVAFLAARTPVGRLGAFGMAMGTWDIFYYVFLWVFSGWPGSVLATDVLFLIPLPWWGPVLSPVLLALLIAGAGAATMARELGDGVPRPRRADVLAILVGAGICLLAFMLNALEALPNGVEAAYYVRGGPFAWPIFAIGAATGVVGLARVLNRPSP
jgi:hypothetical protein